MGWISDMFSDKPNIDSVSNIDDYVEFVKYNEGKELKQYASVEGGANTVGYGHKIKPGEEYKFRDGLTNAQAEHLLKQDIMEAWTITRNMYNNRGIDKQFGPFEALPNNKQLMLTDYVFNGVKVFNKTGYPKMVLGLLSDDWETVSKEYKRSTKVRGGRKELGRRNESTYKYFIDPYLNPTENKVMNK